MRRRETRLPDGRYVLYYTFDDEASVTTTPVPAPGPDADADAPGPDAPRTPGGSDV